MASAAFHALLAQLADAPVGDATVSIQEERAAAAAIYSSFPPLPEARIETDEVAGIRCDRLTDGSAVDGQPVTLYFHGGAYVLGSPETHRALTSRLAHATGGTVVVPDYRLAPEHIFPAAFEDALAVYTALSARVPAASLTLAGDSAGGGLVVATLAAARDRGLPMPAAAVLFSPWLDLTSSGESWTSRAKLDPIVTPAQVEKVSAAYLAGTDPTDWRVSPLFADLAGVPPVLVQVGGTEVLFSDAERLVAKVRSSGGNAELDEWPEMVHAWQCFGGMIPEAEDAISQAGSFLARHAGGTGR